MTKKPTKMTIATDLHTQMNEDLRRILLKHKDKLTPMEMLAVASHFVGVLIALQDQNTMTGDMIMVMVQYNIEEGNKAALKRLEPQEGEVMQ